MADSTVRLSKGLRAAYPPNCLPQQKGDILLLHRLDNNNNAPDDIITIIITTTDVGSVDTTGTTQSS